METFESGQMSKEELRLNSIYAGLIHEMREGRIPCRSHVDELVQAAMALGAQFGMEKGMDAILQHLKSTHGHA